MQKKLQDYLHFYLGCDVQTVDGDGKNLGHYHPFVWTKDGNTEPNGINVLFADSNKVYVMNYPQCKLILRPLSDLKEDDFYSFGVEGTGNIVINATINGMWCSGLYEIKEYDERMQEGLSVEPRELLYELEEADFDNVLSCTKSGQIAYGASDEMRYFVELPTLANWINHLRKRSIDVDGLIKAGLAIDATTLKVQVSDTTISSKD